MSDDGTATVATDVACRGAAAFLGSTTLVCSSQDGLKRIERSGAVAVIDPQPVDRLVSANDGTIVFIRDRQLGHIDRNGIVSSFAIPEPLARPASEIVVGIDGAIWYTAGRNVIRIASTSDYAVFHDDALWVGRDTWTAFTEIVADPNGTMWLVIPRDSRTSGHSRSGSIVSLTLDGAFHEEPVPTSPSRVHRAPDGSFWLIGVAGPGVLLDDPHLMRYSPGRGATNVYVPYLGGFGGVNAFTVDVRGRVWLFCGSDPFGKRLVIRT